MATMKNSTQPTQVTTSSPAQSSSTQKEPDATRPRIAVVTMGVKLGNETRGYTRFRFIAELLAEHGFEVDLITSAFQHWNKAHRDTTLPCYKGLPYRVVFIDEPGYKRNLDLSRIRSHAQAAKNLRAHFEAHGSDYALIYAEIPPNDVARTCAEFAHEQGIPFVADVNDLWPEAMRMVLNIPLVSDIAFWPFERDARRTYELMTAAVGTSDEYAERPAKNRTTPYPRATVYVGNELSRFDAGAREHADEVHKPADEFWVSYAGTLGASYDLTTLIDAGVLCAQRELPIRIRILGDGPDREKLQAHAAQVEAPVDFLGYTDYPLMAAQLCASNVTVNSLVKSAAQSIVTKIGDYLASGIPLINTGSSPEFRALVEREGFGVNVEAERADILADAIEELYRTPEVCADMGRKARACAERDFDQPRSYLRIVELIRSLL